MRAVERNDFENMCELINEAQRNGETSVKIGNDFDGRYYKRLALEHPRMIKKRTGIDDYWIDINTNCGINYLMEWNDTEELKIRRAINIINNYKEDKVADLYGGYGWDYYTTGEQLAKTIDDNIELIEKACGIKNLETYSEYIINREKYLAAWTLPDDDWEDEN